MTTDTPTNSARDVLSRPFNARLPEPMTPDFAQMLLDARTTPDGALELRQRAVAAALAVIAEARDGREHEVRLTTLAQLVAVGRLDEARAMAADLISDRPPTLDGAEFTLKAGRATLTTRAWPFLALAEHLARILETSEGAVNYIEQRMEQADPSRPGYLLTMQRMERPTPHELRRAAEERAKVAEERLEASRAEVKRLRGQVAQSSERGVPWLSQPPDAAMVKAHAEAHPWQPAREGRERAIPAAGLWQARYPVDGTYYGGLMAISVSEDGRLECREIVGSFTVIEEDTDPNCPTEWRPLTADHEPISGRERLHAASPAPFKPLDPEAQARSVAEFRKIMAERAPEIAQLSDHTHATPESGDAESRRALANRPNGRGLAFVASHYLGLDVPQCQKNWYADLEQHKRLVMFLPRGHGATTLARVLVLHRILTDRNARVLFIGGGASEVTDFVAETRHAIDKHRAVFGEGVRCEFAWRSDPCPQPTLRAGRWDDELPESEHYDLIVCDAACKPAFGPAEEEERLARADADRVRSVILPRLADGGQIVFVGPGAHGAPAFEVIAQIDGFATVRENAIVEWPAAGAPADTGRALWPERWPIETLMDARRSIGEPAFSESYQHRPTRAPALEIAQSSEHTHAAPAPAPTPASPARLPRRRSVMVLVPYDARLAGDTGPAVERFAAVRVAKRGGSVEPAGGKVEPGESAYDAAVREAYEELGVPVEVSMRGLGVFEHVHDGAIWHCHAFVGQTLDPQFRGGREGEAAWVTREELTSGTFGALVARALVWLDDRNAPPSCI